jgi:probable rRNA maturation factor
VDLYSVDLGAVERVEVIYGGSDSKYNVTGAVGGVINIITVKKQPPGWHIDAGISTMGSFPGASVEKSGAKAGPAWQDLADTQNYTLSGGAGFDNYAGAGMNRVEVNAEEVPLPGWADASGRYALKALEVLGRDNWDLSVLYCGDAYIRTLNARYRNLDEATDILSFPLGETLVEEGERRYLPGDIVISLDTLAKNAEYFETPRDEELRRLLIHGILHLDGMDHHTNEKTEPMLLLQETILANLAGEKILTGSCAP